MRIYIWICLVLLPVLRIHSHSEYFADRHTISAGTPLCNNKWMQTNEEELNDTRRTVLAYVYEAPTTKTTNNIHTFWHVCGQQ